MEEAFLKYFCSSHLVKDDGHSNRFGFPASPNWTGLLSLRVEVAEVPVPI